MSGEEEIIEVTIDMGELKKMKVPELKKKVAELGLPTKGTKAELLARVEKYLHEQEEEEELLEDEVEEVEEEEEDVEGGGEQEEQQETEKEEPAKIEAAGDDPGSVSMEEEKAQSVDVQEGNSTTTKKRTVSTSSLTNCQADRLAQRASKFGVNTSEEAKKIARAERFGTALENRYQGLGKRTAPTEEELEKMKKRAERFGSSVSPAISVVEEEEKKKKRMERFGLTAPEMSVQERKKLRAARFGTS